MAKGKGSLKDTVKDEEIVRKGEETSKPTYPFPDGEYGMDSGYRDYSLVKKRIAYRTGKEEDGEDFGKVIEYTTWDDVPCYSSTPEGIFMSYKKLLNLSDFKSKKIIKGVQDLMDIANETDRKINEALKGYTDNLTKQQHEICDLTNSITELNQYVKEQQSRLDKYISMDKEVDKMYEKIKEKTTIIINRDKQKNHRMPKENE
jgi:uncharacterized coiled-coil protein SlyX